MCYAYSFLCIVSAFSEEGREEGNEEERRQKIVLDFRRLVKQRRGEDTKKCNASERNESDLKVEKGNDKTYLQGISYSCVCPALPSMLVAACSL